MQRYHLVVYTPLSHADAVRKAVGDAGAGRLGNYSHCSFSSRGTGRFLPLAGAHPTIGQTGTMEEVEEERLEAVVDERDLTAVLSAAKKAHPYEEPAIHLWRIENTSAI